MKRGTHERRSATAMVLALLAPALMLGACRGTQASSGGGPTLAITSPADGASVSSPVKLVLSVQGVKIGPPETGNMHFHMHIDGSKDYTIVTSTTGEVPVPTGQHTIEVVLAEPNHTETDTTASVSVDVTAGGGSGGGGGGRYGGGGGGYGS